MPDRAPWAIHYSDRVVQGATREEWIAAPDDDVHVVVEFRTPSQDLGEWKWTGVTDRFLWTGEDSYDPFGWGVKYGRLISDEEYQRIADEAFYAR